MDKIQVLYIVGKRGENMNKVEEIEECRLLTDEEVSEYEKRSGNTVIRVGSIINLTDKRGKIYSIDITGTYTVIDCDVDTFAVKNNNTGKYFNVLWWDVCGKNPIIVLEKIKY